LAKFSPDKKLPNWEIAKWNEDLPVRTDHWFEEGTISIFSELEKRGVYFSDPMDLDFSMLLAYPKAYGVSRSPPDESTLKAVLGKSHYNAGQYDANEQELFGIYHSKFKLGSKPAAHISALAKLTDEDLLKSLPPSLDRLADAIIAALEDIPE
jgi:hypothetical protein